MKALVWTDRHKLELCHMSEPVIQSAGEVKIEIKMTGICGTDLAVVTGKEEGVPGIIRGHEAVGTIIEIGEEVQRLRVGDRVVIDPNRSCGQCYYCKRSDPHLCVGLDGKGMPIAGLNAQGTFAKYVVSDEKYVHKLNDAVSWEAAVLIEPVACVLHNFHVARVTKEDAVLVLGSGPMGMLSQYVSARQAKVTIATEVNPFRLAFAQDVADMACRPDQLSEEILASLVQHGKFDVVIDTVGTQLEMAERWIDRGGRIVAFGINANYQHTIKPTAYVQQAIQLIGAGEYRYKFEEALQFVTDHPDLARFVTRKYALDAFETAIAELLGRQTDLNKGVISETLKTVFVFD
ncbi:zinc-binding dehydrogenase [Paenibacillus sp. SI8]|uniref:zinc-dependent alcohol dehydrogenase n=1 Tax=unclassified Paenibacillus TaxID=185978 RepID=UPI003465B2DE